MSTTGITGPRSGTARRRRARRLPGVALALVLVPAPAAAQDLRAGAGIGASLLVGDASDFLDGGLGVGGHVAVRIGDSPLLARLDVGYRGLDADADGPSGERAENTLIPLLAGLEAGVRLGPVEPYALLLGGGVANRRTSDAAAGEDGTSWAAAAGGGAGLRVWLGPAPVSLDLGARVLRVGDLTYARTTVSGGAFETGTAILGLEGGITLRLR